MSLGALFTVNLYGYLSVLPSGMMVIIGPYFIFNYSLQFSMSLAMASLLGWQLGDLTFTATRVISGFSERRFVKIAFLKAILRLASLDFLGKAKHLTLRYLLGILSFCFLFSGFDVLFTFLFIAEILIIWIVVSMYLQHRRETESPLPITSWLDEFLDELFETDWKQVEVITIVPIAIFFSLFFSNQIGEDRAERILKSEPVFLSQHDLYATPFATSSAGLILAVSNGEENMDSEPRFIIIGSSGDEILRSFRD